MGPEAEGRHMGLRAEGQEKQIPICYRAYSIFSSDPIDGEGLFRSLSKPGRSKFYIETL